MNLYLGQFTMGTKLGTNKIIKNMYEIYKDKTVNETRLTKHC